MTIACGLLLAISWLGFIMAGGTISRMLADLAGDGLRQAANGKFDDPVTFVHGRMRELLYLATAFLVLTLFAVLIWNLLGRRPGILQKRGVVMGVALFTLMNCFAWAAGDTVLFWALFYHKTRINNFVQYQIKKTLLEETTEKQRLILLGNSQANRAIDERLINRETGATLWATEMTQPGARGFDLLTLSRDIMPGRGDLVLCYVSEISFYGAGSGIVAADFANFRDLPDLFRLNGFQQMQDGAVRSGLIGRLLPIHRFREPLACRVLGWNITNIDQTQADSGLQMDLETRAKEWAPMLQIGESSNFQKQCFSLMIDEIRSRGGDVLLITGHLHPALRKRMNPSVQRDFTYFLDQQQRRHPERVTVLPGERLLHAGESDFTDLVHFNDTAQKAFTRRLINHLMMTTSGKIRITAED